MNRLPRSTIIPNRRIKKREDEEEEERKSLEDMSYQLVWSSPVEKVTSSICLYFLLLENLRFWFSHAREKQDVDLFTYVINSNWFMYLNWMTFRRRISLSLSRNRSFSNDCQLNSKKRRKSIPMTFNVSLFRDISEGLFFRFLSK